MGLFLTTALIVAMRGSAWPTALFLMGGTVLPLILTRLLYRCGVRRFPRLLGLLASLLLVFGLAWFGKHPSPHTAFHDITGTTLPSGARVIDVDRGWYDGQVTLVHFQVDPNSIRPLLLAIQAIHGSAQHQESGDDLADGDYNLQWRRSVTWLATVSHKYATALPWQRPHRREWVIETPTADTRVITVLWDEATGEVLAWGAK